LNHRFGRITLLLAAFAAMGTGALAQSTTTAKTAASSSTSDVLPKYPIPYKTFKTLGAKPKPAGAASSSAGATNKVEPAEQKTTTAPVTRPTPAAVQNPQTTVRPSEPKVAASVAKAPPPTPPVAVAKASPAPLKSATPAPPIVPPPPLIAPQPGARLQPGQPLPGSELEAFVDGQIARAMVSDHIAGAAVAVVQNGQLIMEKGYGSTSTAPSMRIDPRTTLVRLGSASQIFTWIAALKAVEGGKLNLDAPVNTYLPDDLKIPDEGFLKPILMRHLMSHTAGFEDRALGRRYTRDAARLAPLEQALQQLRPRRVRAAGLLSIPSDYGVALAGYIVSKAQGRPFDQLIEDQILKPLALSHTSFREPYPAGNGLPDPMSQALAGRMATGFHWSAGGFEPQPFAYGQSLAPALSASTTADDMARLMIALLNNGKLGETSIYSPKTAALLRAPLQRPAPGMDGWAHGLAMQRLPGGFEALTDVGAAPAFHSNLVLIPSLNLGVFIVADSDTSAGLIRALPGAIVQRFYGGQTIVSQTSPLSAGIDVSGDYLSARRAYHGLEAFTDRLTKSSTLRLAANGELIAANRTETRTFDPTQNAGRFRGADGGELFAPTVNGGAQLYILGSGEGAAERVGGLHSRFVLEFWTLTTALTVFASFAGLFIRDRIDPRETRPQTAANITQVVTCVVWCLAFGAFFLFAKNGLSSADLMFDWPNRWLVLASWSALTAGLLSLLMVTQLPGAWREERRIHGWSVWRKVRHTFTVAVFLVFTGVLASWGALEPWSS
jgi:CubicO group peptidase (beta-lactamase class C family)